MSASAWAAGTAISANNSVRFQPFVATAGQILFEIPPEAFSYVPGTSSLLVFQSAGAQRPGIDFVETSSSSFTMTTPVAEGTIVLAMAFVQVSSTLDALQLRDDLANGADPSKGTALVGFIQSGTGAVLRTAQAKMRETVSVLDFGASPSETGANNATFIQSAFNSGASAIYVPSGTYDIGANTLTLPQNCLVYGDGDSSTIVSSGGVLPIATLIGTSGSHKSGLTLRDIKLKRTNGVASGSLVRFVYADDCSIEGVTFDGNDAAYPGSVVGESVLRLLVDSCEFVGGTSLNLTSEGAVTGNPWSQDCVVRNCYLAPAAWQGFDFYYVKNLIVDGCIANGRTSTYGCGFIIEHEATNVTFTNCISYNNTRSGFYYEPNVAYGLASVTFNNCIAYGNGETGLYAQNTSGLTIHGGAYWGSTGTFVGSVGGISLVGNVLNTSVTGVYIHSNQVNGLLLGACNSVAICNNIFYNNNGNAINVSGVSVGMRLAGNTFNSNSTNITGWVEYQSGTDLDGVWASWSPTWYKADNATVLTVSAQSGKYKRIGNTVHYSVYANISGTPDAVTYFTIPITGAWANGATTDDARRFRGSASGAATAYSEVTGIYSNTRLRITHTAAGDTFIGAQGTYEVA